MGTSTDQSALYDGLDGDSEFNISGMEGGNVSGVKFSFSLSTATLVLLAGLSVSISVFVYVRERFGFFVTLDSHVCIFNY